MEILRFINDNREDFVKIIKPIANNTIHPRISEELQKLRNYLSQPELQEFLNQEKYCIYETYLEDEFEENHNYIEINYLTCHREGYLTDTYYGDEETEFFYNIPAIVEEMESVYGRIMLYNQDREHIRHDQNGTFIWMDDDYYEPSNSEEIYLLQEAVKILCEYPAFQVLECPYH